MKGLKKLVAAILIIMLLYAPIITIFGNETIAAVGDWAKIKIAGKPGQGVKIDGYFVYSKNGEESLDLFCAQKGTSIGSWVSEDYQEAKWDINAGIFKDEASYKKITWIKDNFWEQSDANSEQKYTNEEKLEMLKTVDSSITLKEIKDVFDNKNEKFKLYQSIVWTYTNGNYYTIQIGGSTEKVYNAINKLAENNYKNSTEKDITIQADKEIVYDKTTKTYSWKVNINNTYLLPYKKIVKVDGKETTNYTYDNGIITFSGLNENDNHSFEIKVQTYIVEAYNRDKEEDLAKVWLNENKQNMVEVKTKRRSDSASASTYISEIEPEGYFTLQIKKLSEDSTPIQGVKFIVNNTEYLTDAEGNAYIIDENNKEEITSIGLPYSYTIEEIANEDGEYVALKDKVTINLKSGTTVDENETVVYCISEALFSNEKDKIEVELTNGKTATLMLNVENKGNISKVVLTIPNKDKIFDLALTKTIVYPNEEIIERYDFDFNGVFSSEDIQYIKNITTKISASHLDKIEAIKEEMTKCGAWEHYKYYTEEEIIEKFDVNKDGSIDSMDAADIMSKPAELGAGKDTDRIIHINANNLNKDDITTSTYRMDKSLKQVKKDDIITYRINVYNEGDYDSNEIQITDYLPEGLVVCDEDGNTTLDENKEIVIKHNDEEYTWQVNGNAATTTISETIKAYNGEKLEEKSKYVYIKCKIADTVQNGNVLYNVAEITSAQALDSKGNVIGIQGQTISDRDSENNSLKDKQNIISEYKQNFEEEEKIQETSQNIDKSSYNYEDDDDFERIVLIPDNILDLALRKSITKVGKEASKMTDITNRLPIVDKEVAEYCETVGDGPYEHPKEAIEVAIGDYVEYTIRIFNEGGKDDCRGYAKEITDYLPAGLEFYAIVNQDGTWISSGDYKTEINKYGGYKATYDKENNKVVITCLETPALDVTNKLRKIYKQYEAHKMFASYYNVPEESEVTSLYGYQEVKLICKVTDKAETIYLTNLAEITNSIGIANGVEDETVIDIDSIPGNVEIVKTSTETENMKVNLKDYYEYTEINDENKSYYPGIEADADGYGDDNDFETVKVKIEGKYNLEIKKVGINSKGNVTNEKIEGVTFKVLKENGETYIEETKPTNKDGLATIASNIQITEEGSDIYRITEIKTKDGYIPFETFGLQLTVNKKSSQNGMSYIVTKDAKISPRYLTNWNATVEKSSITDRKVLREFELISKSTVTVNEQTQTITITIPNEPIGEFDLALRKYITKVDEKEYTNRVPKFEIKDGKYTYTHTKDAVEVYTSNIVTYTIRVYNEGSEAGYASKIMDDIPEGLKFVKATYDDEGKPTNTNAKYGWVAYKEATKNDEINELNSIKYNGKTYVITDKSEDAKLIVTDYLSQEEERKEGENLLLPFDETTMKEPYSKTVEVAFEVTEPNTSDRIIINKAQITEDKDENSEDVEDKDSTPNKWIETDDDQDIENIKVKYFDLALRKWVTQAIVIENGKEKVTETGHKAEDNPEKTVLVEIGNKDINDVTVKFKYSIRVTNQGEIPGYATEISDYIPKGLKFVKEDNPDWKEVDGKVVTNKLKDTLLQPNESAEVEIILTWINGENNFGEKVNTAEISEDYNDYGTPDIDSTPNNLVEDEDDIDNAPVKLSIKTGEVIIYTGLAIAVLTILAGGIISIKKFVLV